MAAQYKDAAARSSSGARRARMVRAAVWPFGSKQDDKEKEQEKELAKEQEKLKLAQGLSVGNVTGALMEAQKAWETYDRDRSGTLDIDEVVALLNGPELRRATTVLTNIEPPPRTRQDIQPLFDKADTDKSGDLSRTEFLALYLALVTARVKTNPLVLAEALLGLLDTDRNGRIEGHELKMLLTVLGFPLALILPIPGGVGVDYRAILRSVDGSGGGKK